MNEFYQKLNFKLDSHCDFEIYKGDFYFQYAGNSYLRYFHVDNNLKSNLHSLFSKLTNIATCDIKYVDVMGGNMILPHKDWGLSCCINYYFDPGNAITCWYNEKLTASPIINDEYKIYRYDPQDIALVDKFIAEKNDCYLLNNSKIHSVMKSKNHNRQFIQIQYDTPYEIIKEKLKYIDFTTS